VVRSLSSSCRMRSVFSRIALMLRNINLGGAFSGIRSNSRPKSRPLERDARRLTTNAAPVTAAPLISSFFDSGDFDTARSESAHHLGYSLRTCQGARPIARLTVGLWAAAPRWDWGDR
jgi:hypothetical protein